jgi:hypothetical protein
LQIGTRQVTEGWGGGGRQGFLNGSKVSNAIFQQPLFIVIPVVTLTYFYFFGQKLIWPALIHEQLKTASKTPLWWHTTSRLAEYLQQKNYNFCDPYFGIL